MISKSLWLCCWFSCGFSENRHSWHEQTWILVLRLLIGILCLYNVRMWNPRVGVLSSSGFWSFPLCCLLNNWPSWSFWCSWHWWQFPPSWFLAVSKDSYLKTRFWWAVHQAVWKCVWRSLKLWPLLSSTPFPCSSTIFIDDSWMSWLYPLAFPNSVRSLLSSNFGPRLHG